MGFFRFKHFKHILIVETFQFIALNELKNLMKKKKVKETVFGWNEFANDFG